MQTPKILIIVQGGIAEAVCATADVTVEIIDCDSQDCGFPSIHSASLRGRSWARYHKSFVACLPDCAECGKPIIVESEHEATYCGSMHRDCKAAHASKCEVCKSDFNGRGE